MTGRLWAGVSARGFQERFDAEVELHFVDEIPRTKAGKLRPVVCLVD